MYILYIVRIRCIIYMYIELYLYMIDVSVFPYGLFTALLKNQNHQALDHMHRNGIFHRDVKPWPRIKALENIGNTDMFG